MPHGEQGDTLQAVRGHRFADVLDRSRRAGPDRPCRFRSAWPRRRAAVGVASQPARSSQGEWLETLGIGARAMALAAKNPRRYGKHSGRAAAAVRRGRDGAIVQGDGDPRPDWPDVGGVRAMSVDLSHCDRWPMPKRWPSSAPRTFTETFGHLYQPSDLDTVPRQPSPTNWAQGARRPGLRGPHRRDRTARLVGYAKLGPPHLPFEPRGKAVELRQFYVRRGLAGAGRRPTS